MFNLKIKEKKECVNAIKQELAEQLANCVRIDLFYYILFKYPEARMYLVTYEICGLDCINFYINDKQEELYHLHMEDMLWFWKNYDEQLCVIKDDIDKFIQSEIDRRPSSTTRLSSPGGRI